MMWVRFFLSALNAKNNFNCIFSTGVKLVETHTTFMIINEWEINGNLVETSGTHTTFIYDHELFEFFNHTFTLVILYG